MGTRHSVAAPRAPRSGLGRNALERLAQLRDVELGHLEHGLHGPFGGGRVATAQVVVQLSRHDLPRDAEAILQPAAHTRLAAAGLERLPVVIYLGLVGTIDAER